MVIQQVLTSVGFLLVASWLVGMIFAFMALYFVGCATDFTAIPAGKKLSFFLQTSLGVGLLLAALVVSLKFALGIVETQVFMTFGGILFTSLVSRAVIKKLKQSKEEKETTSEETPKTKREMRIVVNLLFVLPEYNERAVALSLRDDFCGSTTTTITPSEADEVGKPGPRRLLLVEFQENLNFHQILETQMPNNTRAATLREIMVAAKQFRLAGRRPLVCLIRQGEKGYGGGTVRFLSSVDSFGGYTTSDRGKGKFLPEYPGNMWLTVAKVALIAEEGYESQESSPTPVVTA